MSEPLTPEEALRRLYDAADAYQPPEEHDWRCEYRTEAVGWKPGEAPVIRCECGKAELIVALMAADATLATLDAARAGVPAEPLVDAVRRTQPQWDPEWVPAEPGDLATALRLVDGIEESLRRVGSDVGYITLANLDVIRAALSRPLDVERLARAIRTAEARSQMDAERLGAVPVEDQPLPDWYRAYAADVAREFAALAPTDPNPQETPDA